MPRGYTPGSPDDGPDGAEVWSLGKANSPVCEACGESLSEHGDTHCETCGHLDPEGITIKYHEYTE